MGKETGIDKEIMPPAMTVARGYHTEVEEKLGADTSERVGLEGETSIGKLMEHGGVINNASMSQGGG